MRLWTLNSKIEDVQPSGPTGRAVDSAWESEVDRHQLLASAIEHRRTGNYHVSVTAIDQGGNAATSTATVRGLHEDELVPLAFHRSSSRVRSGRRNAQTPPLLTQPAAPGAADRFGAVSHISLRLLP